MEPIKKKKRYAYVGGPSVSVADIDEKESTYSTDNVADEYNEDGTMNFVSSNKLLSIGPRIKAAPPMSDEALNVESIKQAINMGKIFAPNINHTDIKNIADKIATYVRYYKLGSKNKKEN